MKTLLMTGSNGFLGKNILPLLRQNYTVKTLDRDVSNDFCVDLVKGEFTIPESFDVVLHAAGKAHVVPRNDEESNQFFEINYQGTINLCAALEMTPPKSLVYISTVAVYGCESGDLINENHGLNGSSPYAKSKILAEEYLSQWCSAKNVALTILRPSLLAGVDPPGNLGSMVHGISTGRYLNIGGVNAKKSIAMASDIALIILKAEGKCGVFNLCDNHHPSFPELENVISMQLNKAKPISIPFWAARLLARIGDLLGPSAPINSLKLNKITQTLTFSNERLKNELAFFPTDVLSNFKIER